MGSDYIQSNAVTVEVFMQMYVWRLLKTAEIPPSILFSKQKEEMIGLLLLSMRVWLALKV